MLSEAAFAGGGQNGRLIRLDTPLGDDWLLPLYAKGGSRLGRDYEFVVDVASSYGDRIDLKALIAQPVTLWLQQCDGAYLPHHGYVKSFSRLGSDGYLTFYQLRFSSWMCFLPLRRDMRDWQEQTGEQIVADVFDEHARAQGAYRFDLRQAMPRYSNRVQWEDDWNFVHRSLEEAGVFGRFEQAEDGQPAPTRAGGTQKSVAGEVSSAGRTAGGGTGDANGFAEPIMLVASPAGSRCRRSNRRAWRRTSRSTSSAAGVRISRAANR